MATYHCFGISKKGFVVRRREKVAYWCMPFCCVYSLFFLLNSSLFSIICLSTLTISCLNCSPLLFVAIIPIYSALTLRDFSLLPLRLTNHFCLLQTSRQSCLLTYWLLGHYCTWACLVSSLFSTTQSTTNLNPFGFAIGFSPLLGWIRPWVSLSLYLPLWHASNGPQCLPPLLGKDVIPTKHLPKEVVARYWK